MADLVETIVIPEVPRVLDGQELYVYIQNYDFNLVNGEYGSTVYQKNSGNTLTSVKGASVVLGHNNSAYGEDIIQIGDNNKISHDGVKQFGMYLVSAYSYQTYYGTYNDTPYNSFVRTIIGAGNSDLLFNALEAGVKNIDEQDVPFIYIGNNEAETILSGKYVTLGNTLSTVVLPVNDGLLNPTLSMRDIKEAFVVRGQNAGYYLYGRSVNNGVGYENHYPLASNAAVDNVAVRDGSGRIKVHVAYDGYDDYSELSPVHIADTDDSLFVPNMAYLENRYVQRDKTETYPLVVYGQSYNSGNYFDVVKELTVDAHNGSIPLRNTSGEIIVPNTTYSDAAVNYGQMTSYVAAQVSSVQSEKLDKKPDGTTDLIDSNNKINVPYLPDFALGNMMNAGTITSLDNTTATATLTNGGKSRLGTTDNSINLTNNTAAITGYIANENNYYIIADNTGVKDGEVLRTDNLNLLKNEYSGYLVPGYSYYHGVTASKGQGTGTILLDGTADGTSSSRFTITIGHIDIQNGKTYTLSLYSELPSGVSGQYVGLLIRRANGDIAQTNSTNLTVSFTATADEANATVILFYYGSQTYNNYLVKPAIYEGNLVSNLPEYQPYLSMFAGLYFEAGDWLVATASGWGKIDNVDAVKAVNGKTGFVQLQIADIPNLRNELDNRADKVSGATSGNFAGLDSNGNLTDSGKSPDDIDNKLSANVNDYPSPWNGAYRAVGFHYKTNAPMLFGIQSSGGTTGGERLTMANSGRLPVAKPDGTGSYTALTEDTFAVPYGFLKEKLPHLYSHVIETDSCWVFIINNSMSAFNSVDKIMTFARTTGTIPAQVGSISLRVTKAQNSYDIDYRAYADSSDNVLIACDGQDTRLTITNVIGDIVKQII